MKNSTYLPHRRAQSQYTQRLSVFSKNQAEGSVANDLLAPLAQNAATQSALDSYLSKLDETFDVSDVDRVQPFLPLSSSEKLEDIGLRVISLSPADLQHLLSHGFSEVVASDASEFARVHDLNEDRQSAQALAVLADEEWLQSMVATGDLSAEDAEQLQSVLGRLDHALETIEEHQNALNASDNQIRIDRSDVVNRVLKARQKDASVTVVQGPKTAQ